MRYPAPKHPLIIEPFAGAAGYATRYPDRLVLLVERDPVVAALWRYLIRVPSREIMALPDVVEDTRELPVAEEARSLIGFWLNKRNSRRATPPPRGCAAGCALARIGDQKSRRGSQVRWGGYGTGA